MTLPYPYQQHQELKFPGNISDHSWYDFRLDKAHHDEHQPFKLRANDDYVFDIQFHTHPVLIGRNTHTDVFRSAVCDVEYVALIVDDEVIATLHNGERSDIFDHSRQTPGIISEDIDFFRGDPIVLGALRYGTSVVLRMVFWRPPMCPFWITWKVGNVQPHERYTFQNPIYVTDCAGHALSYQGGILGSSSFGRYM